MNARSSPFDARLRRSHRTGLLLSAIAVLALASAIVVCLLAFSGAGNPNDPLAGQDLTGRSVVVDQDAVVPPEVVAKMDAEPDVGTRFVVESVELDVPVGEVNEVDGSLTPPGFESAFQVRNLGVSPADAHHGTVYVVTHSLRGDAVAPGDRLVDVARGTASVNTGDIMSIAGIEYAVSRSYVVPKTELPKRGEVWQNNPDRLVVITCLQRPDGSRSTDNVVIEAMRVAR